MGNPISLRRAAGALGLLLCLLGGAPLGAASAQGIDTTGFAGEVFQLINQQRAANGLPALRGSSALDSSAQSYADAMERATAGGPVFLSHTGPDGSTLEDRINGAGYSNWSTIGENIAAGQKSPQEVMDDWMNSPGHRANILDAQYQDVGIGIAVGPGTWSNGFSDPNVIWWVTDFGASRDSPASGGNSTTPASNSTPSITPNLTPPPPSVINPTPIPAPAAASRTLTVARFGAKGDGAANDSPAIQAAVAAAQPGDSLYFPSGTYRLDTPILIGKSGLTIRGDGAGSVIRHGMQSAFQLGGGAGALTGIGVKGIRFVGAPGQYRADGNTAAALAILNCQATLVQDCEFDGPGIAIADTGSPGTISGTWVLNCRVNGWGSTALVLNSGARVENCSLVQDDPDTTGSHSGSGIGMPSGCSDVQVAGTTIANARALAVQIGGDGGYALTSGIQLQSVTTQNCRAGIAIGGGASNPEILKDVLIADSSLLGTYGGPALSVKQGDGIEIRNNVIDGGPVGLALGLWGPAEPNQSVSNLRAEGNTIRNCDRGIWAMAANGGTLTSVSLIGNTIANCRVPVDLSGAPGVSLSPAPASPTVPAGGPAIGWLANGLQDPITTVQTGHHFLIRGQGFGTNDTGTSRILFIAGGAGLSGTTFLWSDDTIGAVAPIYPGPIEVVVQTEINGTIVTSNGAPLVVQ